MVTWSAHTKRTLPFNFNYTTQNKTKARKASIDKRKSAQARRCVRTVLISGINIRSKRWLISGFYNSHLNSIQNDFVQIRKKSDIYSSKYGNFIFLDGFNAETTNTHREEFFSVHNFKNLIKIKLVLKTPKNPPQLIIF